MRYFNPHANFEYAWFWKAKLPERKGQSCRVLVRGAMNSILVEFESDLYKVVTSRYAVRLKDKPPTPPIESYENSDSM